MDPELHQNKRLREMFRLFQRTKKRGEKKDSSGTEEKGQAQWPKRKTLPARRPVTSKSPIARSPTKRQTSDPKKIQAKREIGKVDDKEGQGEEEEDSSPAADLSVSEKKRRAIRKKYGIDKKDEEFFQRKTIDADAEEFENVNAKFRPAATKMRKAKLRWKSMEKVQAPPSISDSAVKGEKSSTSADGYVIEDIFIDKDIEDLEAIQMTEESRPPTEKIEKLLREIHILLKRVEQLEEIQRKAAQFIKKLRSRLSTKEQRISELSKRIKDLESSSREVKVVEEEKSASESRTRRPSAEEERSASESRSRTSVEVDKPSKEQEAVALRGLAIMKRNQILEQIVKPSEAKILANFFEAENPKPDETIVMLIDKAFGYGIDVLLMRPDLFEDVVDNELRLFLLNSFKAKRILLDCMLLHPEFVPIAWGGNILTKRQQERQLEKEREMKRPAKTRVENEKVRDASVPSASKSFFAFLSNAFGEGTSGQPKSDPQDTSPTKVAEKSQADKSVREDVKVDKSVHEDLKVDKTFVEKREPTAKSREKAEKSIADDVWEPGQAGWQNDRGERIKRKSHKARAPEMRRERRRQN
ncbi:hypothetical protein GCK32_000773 [Trichostrongylus colubriformis]|uniref:DUF7774 domain-containing protein n=1 Tax=Trichostrongylus colubriformis TaxID=6319 RepID=A0AAN8F4T1_TRICO